MPPPPIVKPKVQPRGTRERKRRHADWGAARWRHSVASLRHREGAELRTKQRDGLDKSTYKLGSLVQILSYLSVV